MKKGLTWSGDYILEDSDTFFELLPYLYHKLEGVWEVCIIDPTIKDMRRIADAQLPECVNVRVYADATDIAQFALECPELKTEKVSSYTLYQELFKDIAVTFDPKAVSEIYHRAGPDIDNLKTALSDVMEVSNGSYVTLDDVNKVLLPNKRVYASDVMRAFIGPRSVPYRWSLLNKLRAELGDEYAYYTLRKYVIRLLGAKNKYLINEDVAQGFDRDVKDIDALTIDYAYSLFMEFTSPKLLPAIFFKLERRRHS